MDLTQPHIAPQADSDLSFTAEVLRLEIAEAERQLNSTRRILAAELEAMHRGDPYKDSELRAHIANLNKTLIHARETEDKYNDWLRKRDGTLAAGDIDFDAVRAEIGRRLAGIRDASAAG